MCCQKSSPSGVFLDSGLLDQRQNGVDSFAILTVSEALCF